jgi:hypothetical protein
MRALRTRALVPLIGILLFVTTPGQERENRDSKSKDADKRPRLTLKAQPVVGISPARVTFRAELVGGADDYEELYCPTVEWDWGDGTMSESTTDCEPYQAGKSEIRRHFTVDHIFRAGYHQVVFRLKRRDKVLVSATTTVQIQAGLNDFPR